MSQHTRREPCRSLLVIFALIGSLALGSAAAQSATPLATSGAAAQLAEIPTSPGADQPGADNAQSRERDRLR
jgi:hypothetical protein